ncbi:MAG: DUF3305 domain-containing protein [Gammaproteobacteria bacterium]|nr:DUF3305 domain-containing protein [Gammaproteobacteria bacterium]NIR85366.1 DUF3305 domain-containing protein [Gammaproteobacteria bacterium]NIR88884.1 DUF3305 domain-containing protein [Gammaproteobacteria bacterium]NIU06492.1 DUF3305 domain-containing protein [Gammaproteobacteria bacterium]NIV53385.1 DUF3305 domain-containing protein [Gammaproteobacteria bacterium]
MPSKREPNLRDYRFSVSVVMERRQIRHRGWSVPQWEAVGVVAGESVGEGSEPVVVHVGADREQQLWPGFVLDLARGNAESYWYNLVGSKPSLYIICQVDDGGALAPVRVTADYDEAGAHVEADDEVFAVSIPPEIYQRLERYVVENYKPAPPKKRKRKDWAKEILGDKPPE